MSKIIFLDFDGVLNSQLWYKARKTSQWRPGDHDLSPDSVKLLNVLVKQTGAKVVVSSTWRLNRTVEELQTILDGVGFDGEVIGKTVDARVGKYGDSVLRGNEILHWMKENQDVLGCSYSDF